MIFLKSEYNYCEALQELLKNYYVISWQEDLIKYVFDVGATDCEPPPKKKLKSAHPDTCPAWIADNYSTAQYLANN